MRALVVDDSQTVRMLIRRFGQDFGFEMTEAGDGQEGLDRLGEIGAPELIIVDWKMPGMDGCEFVQTVRANPVYDRTLILMFTSESGLEQVGKALQEGVDDYLAKPCSGKVIREKLEYLVKQIAAGARH